MVTTPNERLKRTTKSEEQDKQKILLDFLKLSFLLTKLCLGYITCAFLTLPEMSKHMHNKLFSR